MTSMILRVPADGRQLEIDEQARADLGTDPACALPLEDAAVDRYHAVVWHGPDGWALADRASQGGTWVAGERIDRLAVNGPLTLHLGDPVTGAVIELEPTGLPATPEPARSEAMRPSRSGASRPTGVFTTMHAAADLIRIGRDPDNDIVLDDLLVSRQHAELRILPGGRAELVDRASLNGTYLNGRRIQRAAIAELDLVSIGHSSFRLVAGHLEEYVDTGAVAVEAAGLSVRSGAGRTLVDDVSFRLPERSLLAVVGPSGSGKSTLLRALSGLRPADEGTVHYGGRDLYADYDELRQRIGLVPQDDVLHRELRVRESLTYAARLRFPGDVTATQRDGRVEEVLDELGLVHRSEAPIATLSGGERKRVNVAHELLTEPSLLLLDEPAAGLDPGLALLLLRRLRALADGGRTVVLVTHEVSDLELCDQILVLAPGGVPAYVGTPDAAPAAFGRERLAEVFGDIVAEPDRDWRARSSAPTHPPPTTTTPPPVSRPRGQGWWSQLRTLSARYLAVLAADRRNAAILLAQGPVLGLLILAALPEGELAPPPLTELRLVSAAGVVLFVVLVGATWIGANNSVREIARELPIVERERAAGLSLWAYVASKALVLGALTVIQVVALVGIATARQRGPGDAVLLGWAPGELLVVVALAGLAAMTLGLCLSAVAGTPERATSILPLVLILQLILAAGVVLPEIVDRPVLRELSLVSSTQWGVAGAASTADLNRLEVFDERLRGLRTVDATDPGPAIEALTSDPAPEGRWAHTRSAWLTAVGVLLLLTVLPLVVTVVVLRRRLDPGRGP